MGDRPYLGNQEQQTNSWTPYFNPKVEGIEFVNHLTYILFIIIFQRKLKI